MIVPDQYIEVHWVPAMIDYYKSKGYKFTKANDILLISAEDLTPTSHKRIKVYCDYCGKIFETTKAQYTKSASTGKICCKNCTKSKYKDFCNTKYGVDNVFQLEETKQKSKQTCIKKYGVESVAKSAKTQEKIKATNLQRYGTERPMQNQEIKDKRTKHNVEKYGVPNPSQLASVKEKIKQTNLVKYGCTCTVHCPEIQHKVILTNLKRYGVPYTTQAQVVIKKMRESCFKNGNCPSSKMEDAVIAKLEEIYGAENCQRGFPCGSLWFDCLLSVDNEKIDIEYDGWYWHKNRQEYDKRRNYFVINEGYKILRIRSNEELPTNEQIIECIDYLVKGNHHLKILDLDIN